MISKVLDVIDKNITDDEIVMFMNDIHKLNPNLFANKQLMDKLMDKIKTHDEVNIFLLKTICEIESLDKKSFNEMSLFVVKYFNNLSRLYKEESNIYFTDSSLSELIRDNVVLHPLLLCNLYHSSKYIIFKGKK